MTVLRPLRPRTFVIADAVLSAIPTVFAHGTEQSLEAATYFLGQTDGATTTVLACVRVRCDATRGSFKVDAHEMRRVIETARTFGLQVVGQMHTHPGLAYHSHGDDEGAQIKHDGFVSVVAPDYGAHLPDLRGVRVYMFVDNQRAFVELDPAAIKVAVAVL